MRWTEYTKAEATDPAGPEEAQPQATTETSQIVEDDPPELDVSDVVVTAMPPTREERLAEAADSLLNSLTAYIVYDGDDVARLSKLITDHRVFSLPVHSGAVQVLHYDYQKEQEASATWTHSHNIYERVAGISKNRACFVKSLCELLMAKTEAVF